MISRSVDRVRTPAISRATWRPFDRDGRLWRERERIRKQLLVGYWNRDPCRTNVGARVRHRDQEIMNSGSLVVAARVLQNVTIAQHVD